MTIVLGVSKLPGQPTLLLHVGDWHGRQHSSLQLKAENGRGGGGGGSGMFRPFAFRGTLGEPGAWWVFGPVTKDCERVTVNGSNGEIFVHDDMNLTSSSDAPPQAIPSRCASIFATGRPSSKDRTSDPPASSPTATGPRQPGPKQQRTFRRDSAARSRSVGAGPLGPSSWRTGQRNDLRTRCTAPPSTRPARFSPRSVLGKKSHTHGRSAIWGEGHHQA